MLAALLAAPVLACGFPLPAGMSIMAVSKAQCAEDEATDTCQARQDAYQMMSQVQSVVVPDLAVDLVMEMPGQNMVLTVAGSYEYIPAETDDGLGANIHIRLDRMELTQNGATESYNNVQVILIGGEGYVSEDGGATWSQETLTDMNTLNGLSMMLGLGGSVGAGLDLYSNPATFAVTAGSADAYNGQAMQSQTMTLDIATLMTSTDTMSGFLAFAENMTGQTLIQEGSGFDLAMLADPQIGGMLLLFMAGSELGTTIHIGADDGLIHYISENHIFNLDAGTMNEQFGGPIYFSYVMTGHIEQHNAALVIVPPTNISGEGSAIFGDDGGLGSGLFGN